MRHCIGTAPLNLCIDYIDYTIGDHCIIYIPSGTSLVFFIDCIPIRPIILLRIAKESKEDFFVVGLIHV